MKSTKRRILSIVLALVMVACMIPLGAITSFATDSGTFADLQQLIYDAADGGTIKLTKNYIWGKDDDDPLMIKNEDSTGKTLTIDMNGHKISGDSDCDCIAVDRWIEEGTTSKLTLIDNSASGGGTICSGYFGVYVDTSGTLIAKNIKFTGNRTGVYNSECCMIIENCEFTGNYAGIENCQTMAVTDTTFTGNEYGIVNHGGDLYIGGSTKVTDNEEANIYLEKDTYKYTGESAWADEFYDLAPFTLGDGTTQIEALGNYVVKAPSNDFNAGITTWEYEDSTPMYYDELNMEWYPDWGQSETVKDEACAGAFTTNGTADDVKYFFADDTTYSVAYNSKGYLELVAPSGETDITEIITTPTKIWTPADYSVQITDRAIKFQFIDANGNTWTYPRDKAENIVSYDKDGNVLESSESRELAYEVWTVTATLPAGNYTVKAKYSGTGWQTDPKRIISSLLQTKLQQMLMLFSMSLKAIRAPQAV